MGGPVEAPHEKRGVVMRIGFIGLGNMGGPMALNLIKAGHSLIVNDVRRDAAAPHLASGAKWADSPQAARAGERADPDVPARAKDVEAVALGPNGIIHGAVAGNGLRGSLDRLAHDDAKAPRGLQGQGRARARLAGLRRGDRRPARHASGDGRRRGGDLQRGQGRAQGRGPQRRLHGADRRRHDRQARPQHDLASPRAASSPRASRWA